MVKIVCLANSKKNGDRCIAGINICTGKWVRPVSELGDGRIPVNRCLVNGEEPELLDILDIPFRQEGFGHECENLPIVVGEWEKIGKVIPNSLLKYCESEIFYSKYIEKVPKSFLDSLPLEEKRTLQLVRATVKQIRKNKYQKWEASLLISDHKVFKAKITDLAMINKLNQGVDFNNKDCLFTISLAQPWRKNNCDELSCWKLIAGVIELS